jgi:hypothetical protein
MYKADPYKHQDICSTRLRFDRELVNINLERLKVVIMSAADKSSAVMEVFGGLLFVFEDNIVREG